MRVLFFGTPLFAAETLAFLFDQSVDIIGIISKPDLPKGRGLQLEPTPVHKVAMLHPEIPFFQPEVVSDPAFYATIEGLKPDLFVVVAYGEILKESLLKLAAVAAINLHTSILPKYRGAAPIQRAIISGESKTGVTIIHMAKKMDAGDIILQKEIDITSNDTYGELEKKILTLGQDALLEAIHQFEAGTAKRIHQNESTLSFAPKIELEECEIILDQMTAVQIHNLVRGTNPAPGAFLWVFLNGEKKRLKVYRTQVVEGNASPKTVISWGKGGLILGTSEGAIQFIELQLEGKKRLTADEFMRGQKQEALGW